MDPLVSVEYKVGCSGLSLFEDIMWNFEFRSRVNAWGVPEHSLRCDTVHCHRGMCFFCSIV